MINKSRNKGLNLTLKFYIVYLVFEKDKILYNI